MQNSISVNQMITLHALMERCIRYNIMWSSLSGPIGRAI